MWSQLINFRTQSIQILEHFPEFRSTFSTGQRRLSKMSYQQHQQANDDNLAIKTLDSQDLESLCPLDNDRHDFDLSANSPDLGNLELSLELTELIIKHLDIPSLTTFRRVSKRAMHMVDSTFEYAQIMNRAPQM
jgi:hypothetical protein